MPPRHQEEGTPHMPGTAQRQEDEGGPEADALFIKQLQQKERKVSVTRMFTAAFFTICKGGSNPSVRPEMSGSTNCGYTCNGVSFSLERKAILPQGATWMNPEDTMLRDYAPTVPIAASHLLEQRPPCQRDPLCGQHWPRHIIATASLSFSPKSYVNLKKRLKGYRLRL